MAEQVSIGVPVYRGTAFVAEALRSIQNQTYHHIDVTVSVDGADFESAAACDPFMRDSRFRMVVQDRQLGWAENISFLMAASEGDFWYYHQQDDLVAPDYVQSLLEYARANATAAVVYCDMEAFGELTVQLSQQPVIGPAALREIILLHAHHPAVAFRGLTRRDAVRQSGGVRGNEVENFSSDTTWMASMARSGELHRIPRVMYYKRYHANNVHTKWALWPLDRRKHAWQVHCRDMFLEAALAESTIWDRRLMWSAALARLTSPRVAGHYLPVKDFGPVERAAMLEGFLAAFGEHSAGAEKLLESAWATLSSDARVFLAAG
jgi:glycosyltransferase involved in cell wall biosynthesis